MSRENLMLSLMVTGGVAIGALTMYFFDPARGRQRRTQCMDQLNSAAHTVKDAVESTAHDLSNRARGLMAEAKSSTESSPSPETETTTGELAAA